MTIHNEIISKINELDPIPQAVNKLLEMSEDPATSLSEIADIIVYDPVMTANMIRMCNSAFYALPREIESIHDATVLLGLDQIIEMFLFRSAFDNLGRQQEGYGLEEGQLLTQAVSGAIISKSIAGMRHVQNRHMIFTAALLKDIGKVILGRYVKDAIEEIRHLVAHEKLSFIEAEKQVLGIDHASLGGLMAENWGFSPQMAFIIKNHHLTDTVAREDMQTAIVYMADSICMMMGINAGVDAKSYTFYEEITAYLKLSEENINSLIVEALDNKPKVEALVGTT